MSVHGVHIQGGPAVTAAHAALPGPAVGIMGPALALAAPSAGALLQAFPAAFQAGRRGRGAPPPPAVAVRQADTAPVDCKDTSCNSRINMNNV